MHEKKEWVITYLGSSMEDMREFYVERNPIVEAEDDIEAPKPEIQALFEECGIDFLHGSITYGRITVRGTRDSILRMPVQGTDAFCPETGENIFYGANEDDVKHL